MFVIEKWKLSLSNRILMAQRAHHQAFQLKITLLIKDSEIKIYYYLKQQM